MGPGACYLHACWQEEDDSRFIEDDDDSGDFDDDRGPLVGMGVSLNGARKMIIF